MAAISLPSKVLGRKVKNVFLDILGEAIAPICPSLATPMGLVTYR